MERNRKGSLPLPNDRGGVVSGAVVDNQHIPGHARRHGHTGKTVERFSERLGAVVSTDEDGRGW
jgi:hypothetical protein